MGFVCHIVVVMGIYQVVCSVYMFTTHGRCVYMSICLYGLLCAYVRVRVLMWGVRWGTSESTWHDSCILGIGPQYKKFLN